MNSKGCFFFLCSYSFLFNLEDFFMAKPFLFCTILCVEVFCYAESLAVDIFFWTYYNEVSKEMLGERTAENENARTDAL